MKKERHPVTAVVLAPLLPAHPGVEDLTPACSTVVGGEDEDGVVMNTELLEQGPGLADIVVDIRDHTEEGGNPVRLSLVHVEVILRAMQGPVRGIGANVGEEWFFRPGVLTDELVGLLEEDIGAKALRLDDLLVVEVATVEIGIIPDVGGLAHATATMAIHLVKPAILRAIGIVVPHVPLAKHARLVAIFLQHLPDGTFIGPQHGTAHNRVPYARSVGPVT